ncbi:MAG: hypothetical protein K1X64_15260 [Myxococcaceae bacterium]|nr:hypothetical protein [Myxococcaceae bacterium]
MPSKGLGLLRGFYVPLGLFALIAVGVHGAADVLDDYVLRGVERLDAWLDTFWAMNSFTESWVDAVSSLQRTWIARAVAFAWEIAADLVVALPCLNYFEEERADLRSPFRWGALLSRLNQKPTLTRLTRPFIAGIFAGTGAWTISRAVESALYPQLSALEEFAAPTAHTVSLISFALVLGSLAWRCAALALMHADSASEKRPGFFAAGVWGTAVVLPLAVAAIADLLLRFGGGN